MDMYTQKICLTKPIKKATKMGKIDYALAQKASISSVYSRTMLSFLLADKADKTSLDTKVTSPI